ncbi:hypothetical protein [Anaerotignum sp.]|uniref:hypothetical protein n=1 Tax=Anaerotignum sp. TaxID=2039241 RepID=UPI002A9184B1|nr:hypothetical protein [Anaerotignum sp.]MCI7658442.1 hypothetical protein [Clostridia bacterium]MDY5414232.1 hypothetical protein [Anaerotignum sp.]
MDDLKQKNMTDTCFESTDQNTAPKLPSQDTAAEETLWKKSMNRILVGITLTAITLNFGLLNYIFPTIGTILLLFGFRTLQHENKWFRNCFAISIIRTAYFFVTLILNTTILQSTIYSSTMNSVLPIANLLLQFALFVCLWQGFISIRQKAGLPPHAGSAAALIVWYCLICLLALAHYNGFFIALIMFIAYCRIIYKLNKLSKELDEIGYEISTVPVKWTNQRITFSLILLLLAGGACGYLFCSSYPMEWNALRADEHKNVEDIKAQLIDLGFPSYILNDLSAEDIAACNGALQVVVDETDIPLEDYGNADDFTSDTPNLRVTGIGVKVSDDRERWIIFHHFLWTKDPGFYGTEAIQLWPVYRDISDGWDSGGDVTGRVLYNSNDETFVADYYSLGTQTYTSNNFFFGSQDNTDVFATFSMPRQGSSYRGYIAYPIKEIQDGCIISSWINYVHQRSWMQYPVMTAMEKRMTNSWNYTGAFQTLEDALQFYPSDEGIEMYN